MKNLYRWIAVLALQCLATWGVQASSPPYAYAFDGYGGGWWDVVDQRNLVVVDVASGTEVKKVPVASLTSLYDGFADVLRPLDWGESQLAVSPDSRMLYIRFDQTPPPDPGLVMYEGAVMLSVDLTTMTPVAWFPLFDTFFGPGPFIISPDGARLFAASGDTITIFALPGGEPLGEIHADPYLHSAIGGMVGSPGGHRLYVMTSTRLYAVDADNNQVLGFVRLGYSNYPSHADASLTDLTVTADGSTVYSLLQTFIDSANSDPDVLVSVSTRGWQVSWTMDLPSGPRKIIVNRAGDTAYVAYQAEIVVVDLRDRKIVATIPVGEYPEGIALTPDERQIYVESGETMSIVSTETNTAVKMLAGFGLVRGKNFIASGSDSLPVAKEFYHAAFDHYFLTSSAIEIDALNAGLFDGWAPTGQTVSVFPQAAGSGSVPVCRYFSAAFAPKSSHFYGLRGGDCEAVPNFFGWEYEGDVFFAARPNASGQCPAGAMPLYRVYNDGMGGAPAHRFTTSLATHQTMIAAGWIPEGPGAGVGMCVPE
jgi:DNA-binding beta-propeller fold protein YncE